LNFNNPPFKTRKDIAGLKVTIMGLGLNGGGLATAAFFARNGARVTVTDKKTEAELAPSIEALAAYPDIRYVLGAHDIEDFRNADVVIKNPGVKLEGNEYLQAALSIETDISVFLRFTRAPILAVTGSKGKSSTVSALYFGLKELGYPAFLGGNITVSPLTFLDATTAETPVVLELSSWQLADLRGRGLLKPRVAILTPVMPDHQNWYGGMEPYVADKKLIYADQDASCHLIVNLDDEWGPVFASEARAHCCSAEGGRGGPEVHWYSAQPLPDSIPGAWLEDDGRGFMRGNDPRVASVEILPAKVTVPGAHMRQNLLNAAQALVLFGADPAKAGDAMARFPGIEHRLEFFHEESGVRFYNDSAATIPEAVAAAIDSFESPPILLAGGTDKNLDFTPLADASADTKRIILLAGTGTDKLTPLLAERGIPFDGPFASLAELVAQAKRVARTGDVVVFSPGATSFGLFKNEFDRGNKFKEAVIGTSAQKKS
jgi:UDP-N-acetylmuramoylalanine--D-glutamate ligase